MNRGSLMRRYGGLRGLVMLAATGAMVSPSAAIAGPSPADSSDGATPTTGDTAAQPSTTAPPSPREAVRAPALDRAPRAEPSRRNSAFNTKAKDRRDPYGTRPPGVAQLDLPRVLELALQNPAVKAADEDISAMESQLRKVKFAWVPTVQTRTGLSPGVKINCDDVNLDNGTQEGFDFQYCRTRDDNDFDVNTVRGYFSQLTEAGVRFEFKADIVIPITTFGKVRNLKRLAKVGLALEKLEKLQIEQETALRVYQAHTTLLLARESISILREANDIIEGALKRVTADLGGDEDDWDADPDEGADATRDPDDLYKVKLAALEVEQLMRQALKVESLALSALWALAGKAAPTGFDVAEKKLVPYPVAGGRKSLRDYHQLAQRNRPEARMAAAAVKAREFQQKIARANFLPDLGVVLSTGVARSNSADVEMSQLYYQDGFNWTRFTAALALRWNWDFHFKAFDLKSAQARTRAAAYREEAAHLLLGRDVEQAYGDLVEAEYLIDTHAEAVDLTWRLVVSGQQKDSIGGGNAGDLLKHLEKWYKRRFDHAQAIQTHNDALARLSRAVGAHLTGEIATGDPASGGTAQTPETASQ